MAYGEETEETEDPQQQRSAFREAEKKYQLFREMKMKMKGSKLRAGKLVTRPTDLSEVLDLRDSAGHPPTVRQHTVAGCAGRVYTFTQHPGLVYLPHALPPEQQQALLAAALTDYPQPPARTNHSLAYGPLPGLWRAAAEGLRLRWARRDDPHAGPSHRVGCGHMAAKPHKLPGSAPGREAVAQGELSRELKRAPASAACDRTGRASPSPSPSPSPSAPQSSPEGPRALDEHRHPQREHSDALGACGAAQPAGAGGGAAAAHGSACGPSAAAERHGGGFSGGARSDAKAQGGHAVTEPGCRQRRASRGGGDRDGRGGSGGGIDDCEGGGGGGIAACQGEEDDSGGCSGEGVEGGGGRGSECSSSRSSSASGGLAADLEEAQAPAKGGELRPVGPSFEECWAADGPGPEAAQLLRKLRWATLGPQFDWGERQYDFTLPYRRLPDTLSALARQMAGVVGALQGAGLEVLPRGAAGCYAPDAAIVNYYQAGDMLGGHLDDVERDMAQPIVAASLGADAVFLMGGTTRDVAPTALRLRSGDVVVLAGQARRCYHGVPRVLERAREAEPPERQWAFREDAPPAAVGPAAWRGMCEYARAARVNISIRAVG